MLRDPPDAHTAAEESVHEHSALLKHVPQEVQNKDRAHRQPKRDDLGDRICPKKLGWIMASVWLGTFCAGLGKHLTYD